MYDIDEKVYRYTLDFARQARLEISPVALYEGIRRHMESARKVVTNATLERIGHVHVSLMINVSARHGLSLGEVVMEAVRCGSQPVASLCAAICARKREGRLATRRPSLRLVK